MFLLKYLPESIPGPGFACQEKEKQEFMGGLPEICMFSSMLSPMNFLNVTTQM